MPEVELVYYSANLLSEKMEVNESNQYVQFDKIQGYSIAICFMAADP